MRYTIGQMNVELIVTNIALGFTFLINIGLAVLVYVRRPREGGTTNVIFALNTLAFCIWQASYFFGINLQDPLWSRFAFMFNLASPFVVIMNVHLLLALTGRVAANKRLLSILYIIAVGMCAFFALHPDSFMLASAPQLYLPNFFVLGPLYIVQDTFFFIVLIYLLTQFVLAYRSADAIMRNRLKYFISAIVYAYIMSLSAEFLLYGIPFDPILASISGLYAIPMAYAILRFDLVDIRIVAKRALIYALGTTIITLFILFIGYANDWAGQVIPGFPRWPLPLLSGVLGVSVGVLIWRKIQEADYLKFQFVDVVTHKFRTPLTHIKWSAEMLRTETDPVERGQAINAIEDANTRLFEMTNSLVGLSRSDDSQYQYVFKTEHIVDLLNETLAAIESQVRSKKIRIALHVADHLPNILVDRKRVQFVMQMIMENAVIYSKSEGVVDVTIEQRKAYVYVSVRDTGIGISPEDMSHLFSRFFRGTNASEAHTEGLGIGLFVSRDIMKRHGGDLWAESAGIGKGSTFYMKIPLEK